ncbi:MAG: nucleoside hydrolase [Spirochaetes bacterium]|uniref:Nucleoside hydrolase n=1 Tax=Candidatus Ornithospirochaeta stercoripullorum TaxID=2840899 RepID=A0A9D9DXH5_9SPIO|nr:nucleoside hydrolase [Candidatus Ornithospirochaeta stercoripullorum]
MLNLILDLDTGVDDSIALSYAALNPEVNLLGVTGTFGNVTTDMGARNALAVLAMMGRSDVPVFEGAYHSLTTESFSPHDVSVRIHGRNGTGNVVFPAAERSVEKEAASDFLIRMMRQNEDMVIVTTGPSTNLASALMKAPELSSWKGRVVIMGGALTVRGNVSHFAEANISQDPEAAKIVFESGLDVTMVGLDVTMRSRLRKSDAQAWRATGTEAGKAFAGMLEHYILNTIGGDDTYVHDPSAVVCALHPEYFSLLPLALTVELDGADRGRTVGDESRILEKAPKTRAAVNVDSGKVEKELKIIGEYFTRIS